MQRKTMIEVYKTTEKLSNEWNKAARHGEGPPALDDTAARQAWPEVIWL